MSCLLKGRFLFCCKWSACSQISVWDHIYWCLFQLHSPFSPQTLLWGTADLHILWQGCGILGWITQMQCLIQRTQQCKLLQTAGSFAAPMQAQHWNFPLPVVSSSSACRQLWFCIYRLLTCISLAMENPQQDYSSSFLYIPPSVFPIHCKELLKAPVPRTLLRHTLPEQLLPERHAWQQPCVFKLKMGKHHGASSRHEDISSDKYIGSFLHSVTILEEGEHSAVLECSICTQIESLPKCNDHSAREEPILCPNRAILLHFLTNNS